MLNVAVDFVEEIDGWDEGCPRNFKKMFLQRVRFVTDIEWKCFNYNIVRYIYIGQNDLVVRQNNVETVKERFQGLRMEIWPMFHSIFFTLCV